MDPQATISAIVDCIDNGNVDDFNECFVNLHQWLKRGGFAPVVTAEPFKSSIVIARLPNRTYHIQSVCDGNNVLTGDYEFAVYNARGDFVESWLLR